MEGLVAKGESIWPLPGEISGAITGALGSLPMERLLIVGLDQTGGFLGEAMLNGQRGALTIRYRTIFAAAFELGASGIVLAHNHPSGLAEPSRIDIAATTDLISLARPLDIAVLDHLIVTSEAIFSMRLAQLAIATAA